MKDKNFPCLHMEPQQIKNLGFFAAQIFRERKWNIQKLNLEFFVNLKCFWDSLALKITLKVISGRFRALFILILKKGKKCLAKAISI
jgi:hypothetical protein